MTKFFNTCKKPCFAPIFSPIFGAKIIFQENPTVPHNLEKANDEIPRKHLYKRKDRMTDGRMERWRDRPYFIDPILQDDAKKTKKKHVQS